MNVIGYVKYFGDKTFDEVPLNEVDSVIFSCLSYYDWEEFAPDIKDNKPSIEFKDVVDNDEDMRRMTSISLTPKDDYKLWKQIIFSKRFRNVKLNYFSHSFSTDRVEQFAAITFILPDGSFVVTYRGTDATLIGWKEDFDMALFDKVPSQIDAALYLEEITRLLPNRRFYISGHSKGGNLAMYACTHMSAENKENLIMARSHDGPGFRDVDSHIDALIPILNKTSSTVPYCSIIGTLLGFRNDSKIIKSKSFLVLQHNPYKWQVSKKTGDFIYLQYRSKASMRSEVSLSQWINSFNEEEKARLITLIFDILDAEHLSVADYRSSFLKQLKLLVTRYRGLSKFDKKFFSTMFWRLFGIWHNSLFKFIRYKKKKTAGNYEKVTIFGEDEY